MSALEKAVPRALLCCVPPTDEANADGATLGSVFSALGELLLRRSEDGGGGWRQLRSSTLKPYAADLILGGPVGSKIPWKALRIASRNPSRKQPLVSFYQGFECVCRKAMLVRTLRAGGGPGALPDWLPQSYLVVPGRPEFSEHAQLAAAHARRGGDGTAHWILKPSDGAKGAGICVMRDLAQIQGFLAQLPAGSIAWVVSAYLERPLLLPGDRKFDVRIWVLLDAAFNVFVWRHGVLRTCSVPFRLDADSLADEFVHLSNHCIQAKSPSFGHHESATNELSLDGFDTWLKEARPGESVCGTLAPQWNAIIHATLAAGRDRMEVIDDFEPFRCFQVFGFDFMIDQDLKVWLIEVNSSPAIAEHLAEQFAHDLKVLAIDAYLDSTQVDEALAHSAFVHVPDP